VSIEGASSEQRGRNVGASRESSRASQEGLKPERRNKFICFSNTEELKNYGMAKRVLRVRSWKARVSRKRNWRVKKWRMRVWRTRR